jgi:hypothetical protein
MKAIKLIHVSIIALSSATPYCVFAETVYAPIEYQPKIHYAAPEFTHKPKVIDNSNAVVETKTVVKHDIETRQVLQPKALGIHKPSDADQVSHSEQLTISKAELTNASANSSGGNLPYLGIMLVIGLALLFVRRMRVQNQVVSSQSSMLSAQTITVTRVERYFQALGSEKTGVEKYLQRQSNTPALTGVAKYIAKQVVKDRVGLAKS